jgi:two-component system sensor histidine kinase/response regulator
LFLYLAGSYIPITMNTFKEYSHWLYLIIFLILVGPFFYFLQDNFEQKELEARQLKLTNQHQQSIDQFKSSVDKVTALVSGMRSYMNMSPEHPSATEFQTFVRNQYNDLRLRDSLVVTFIDTAHIFRQSFSYGLVDPANLVGRSVTTFRSREKIEELDQLMEHDSIVIFPPINLVEEWVGLPINFRVHRKGVTEGYVAPIFSLKTILNEIYRDDMNNEFVFHFSTDEGNDFDRERAYNNTEVYNKKEDPEYYKNFDRDPSVFLYSNVHIYGLDIRIGTAYKQPYAQNTKFSYILWFSFLSIAILATVVAWQINRARQLNFRLFQFNRLLQSNRQAIQQKNNELKDLTNTQNKFFSIIGHDIKQPLSAIEGLLGLLMDQEIQDDDLREIIKGLTSSTKNTTTLLNNLLRWARSQTGELKFIRSRLDIKDVLEEVSTTLFFQAKEKSIKLNRQCQQPIMYEGDVDMLSTIFRNLISNAIKFTHPGGEILIDCELTKEAVTIIVRDNGIGMKPEEIASLFKLDEQISTVGTYGEMGTGLGLILCYDFTKKHGGDIEVESTYSKGTQFKVILPFSS